MVAFVHQDGPRALQKKLFSQRMYCAVEKRLSLWIHDWCCCDFFILINIEQVQGRL